MVELVNGDDVTRAVIDCGPDFREQMLAASVTRIDGLLITHRMPTISMGSTTSAVS